MFNCCCRHESVPAYKNLLRSCMSDNIQLNATFKKKQPTFTFSAISQPQLFK